MARVTSSDVAAICELDATIPVDPFIAVATLLVDEELAIKNVLSAARLKEIERYLAAHFYCVRDPRAQSESAGVSQSYEGSASDGLKRTRFGQQAIILDTTGRLNTMQLGRRPASIAAMGADGGLVYSPGISDLGSSEY